jgi:DNA-binding beta-propeller fold protein YncE
MRNRTPFIVSAGVAGVIGLLALTISAAGARRVVKRISISGDTGWDYISADTQARRLYVPHGIEVVVIDLDSGSVVGKITGLKGAHGVAVAPEFGRGFVDATDPGSVTIFDLKTLGVIDKIRVGDDPNGIIYDAKLKRIFTADRGSKRLTAIDAKSGKVVGEVDNLDGRTEHLASDEAGHVFLNIQDRGNTLKIDAVNMRVLQSWPVAPCGQPSSMDMDRVYNRVFIGCRSGLLAVLDGDSGRIVASEPIGPGVDAVEFDSAKSLIYSSTGGGEGALSIFHQDGPDKYSIVQNVKTLPGARTMALDHKTGLAYLPVADLGPAGAPTPENPNPRPRPVPGTFSILVVGE